MGMQSTSGYTEHPLLPPHSSPSANFCSKYAIFVLLWIYSKKKTHDGDFSLHILDKNYRTCDDEHEWSFNLVRSVS